MDRGTPRALQFSLVPTTPFIGVGSIDDQERADLVAEVYRRLRNLPLRSVVRTWLPERELADGRQVCLSSPGKYRPTTINECEGFTLLYVSTELDLFEYGPAQTHPQDPLTDNLITLRAVRIFDLDVTELKTCRRLLWSGRS